MVEPEDPPAVIESAPVTLTKTLPKATGDECVDETCETAADLLAHEGSGEEPADGLTGYPVEVEYFDDVDHLLDDDIAGDAGMSTVEYAVGTIAAAAFAAVLYKIVTGDSVISGLTRLINNALTGV